LKTYNHKKVFITGHTGFKGSWLAEMLNVLGAEVSGFALPPYTTPSHFALLSPSLISTLGDVSQVELLKESLVFSQPEIVFHLAAQPLVRDSYKNPIYTYQTNVIGTLHLLEAVKACPSVRAVVVITTDKVYENKEWEYPYRENDELGGYDMYSSSKACTEILVNSYKRSFFQSEDREIFIATARAGNVIGGGDWSTDRLIPDIVRATAKQEAVFIRNPQSVRPWQHVLDCLYGYLLLGKNLLEGKKAFTKAWNFAPYSMDAKTVAEVAAIAQSIWNEVDIAFGKPDEDFHEAGILKLDNTQAMSQLHWKPLWNTQTAIEKTIAWYKAFYEKGEILTHQQIAEYLHGIH
jgi:CDP-glucose 4,6-dehydratase